MGKEEIVREIVQTKIDIKELIGEDSYASGEIKFWAGLSGILGIYPATMLDISIIIFGALLFLKIIGG